MHAYYGKSHILQGVSMNVKEGEIVALLGRNGVGRSTTCKAIMGEVAPQGSVKFKGQEIAGKKAFEIANLGIGYVPENRDIFPGLTTRQNLTLGLKPGQKDGAGRWSMQMMFDMFENLDRRADVEASVLSGGEQQMLTMCRTLMGDPDFVMIDEPTEGLSPQMVQKVAEVLKAIAERGISTLLVEQKLSIAMDIADRVYVMGHGQVVFEGTPDELKNREDVRKEWLEV
ncbi:ABC transporter ATP-binding protein [Sulfitobacter geojensis]|uniref:ABC transporter ATP-binding protein n=1 Tax=Sulfitobacter geojensis TaxID=1342299 RepID=A0AAE2W351_9RHOB|nr:ABC transporter ATP-binding protein [Sulfitobacter geojensis]MBM1691483.1 ABC transporter ATP-binding protein [Sulfitobacter geojensis]MBM1695549.1 ABC transporter ATP-binding protein [Sulfitobacter geojensis]MBM1707737.1 ABC transporter ATP-binding protein [Sulfitobacter geojensis]MBM1711799.1 ABC transporter ATP-binding protein [Sulfitobacter geojensis]MBM1715862.1 ABC transporter ATP-binding protein [Sulfitobacter geojensis]